MRVGRVVSGRGLTGYLPPRCRSRSHFSGGQTDSHSFFPPSWESCSTGRSHGRIMAHLYSYPPTHGPRRRILSSARRRRCCELAIVGSSPQLAVSPVGPSLSLVVCSAQAAVMRSVGRDPSRFRLPTIGATLRPWHFRAMHVVVEGVIFTRNIVEAANAPFREGRGIPCQGSATRLS